MRRSASEMIRDLEVRIARLEKQANNFKFNTMYYSSVLPAYFYPLTKLKNGKIQGVQMDLRRGSVRLMSHPDDAFRDMKMEIETDISAKDEAKILSFAKEKGFSVTASTRKQANNLTTTIVKQLGGGRKLQMFIGLKQLINEPNGVTLVFPLPKHPGAVNRVRITLNGADLYDMEFIRTRGSSQKIVKEFNDVYAEDLRDRFEEGTGLYIRF